MTYSMKNGVEGGGRGAMRGEGREGSTLWTANGRRFPKSLEKIAAARMPAEP